MHNLPSIVSSPPTQQFRIVVDRIRYVHLEELVSLENPIWCLEFRGLVLAKASNAFDHTPGDNLARLKHVVEYTAKGDDRILLEFIMYI